MASKLLIFLYSCTLLLLYSHPVSAQTYIYPRTSWITATPAEVGMDAAKLTTAKNYASAYGGAGMITRGWDWPFRTANLLFRQKANPANLHWASPPTQTKPPAGSPTSPSHTWPPKERDLIRVEATRRSSLHPAPNGHTATAAPTGWLNVSPSPTNKICSSSCETGCLPPSAFPLPN
ncbi:MAG: hypothetical protein UX86_C0048G0007 [Candidatus Amesbacteria bacterium GW2011_GWC1_47_15]|uniref:Uncharacterized protein n=1 Tax=Candidatus Amesbacteria bacterium GW2011_GWC1_47_15 TaxID=1618364 RepID=A0A0G1RYS3_9BACT|nr:MAG: hypothetical protein UX86_C0048G0007 [Candidatus Amesbacteria bacterium GW2011_GWC1_47_15]